MSKFAKESIFGGFNNLKDITLDKRYATIYGYTQNDLETVFSDHLQNVNMPKVRVWYKGAALYTTIRQDIKSLSEQLK